MHAMAGPGALPKVPAEQQQSSSAAYSRVVDRIVADSAPHLAARLFALRETEMRDLPTRCEEDSTQEIFKAFTCVFRKHERVLWCIQHRWVLIPQPDLGPDVYLYILFKILKLPQQQHQCNYCSTRPKGIGRPCALSAVLHDEDEKISHGDLRAVFRDRPDCACFLVFPKASMNNSNHNSTSHASKKASAWVYLPMWYLVAKHNIVPNECKGQAKSHAFAGLRFIQSVIPSFEHQVSCFTASLKGSGQLRVSGWSCSSPKQMQCTAEEAPVLKTLPAQQGRIPLPFR